MMDYIRCINVADRSSFIPQSCTLTAVCAANSVLGEDVQQFNKKSVLNQRNMSLIHIFNFIFKWTVFISVCVCVQVSVSGGQGRGIR